MRRVKGTDIYQGRWKSYGRERGGWCEDVACCGRCCEFYESMMRRDERLMDI